MMKSMDLHPACFKAQQPFEDAANAYPGVKGANPLGRCVSVFLKGENFNGKLIDLTKNRWNMQIHLIQGCLVRGNTG